MRKIFVITGVALPIFAQVRVFRGVDYIGDKVWVCARDTFPNIYYSPDNGLTWEERGADIGGHYMQLWDVDFVNDTMGWAAGWSGVIFKTINGGKEWLLQDYGTTKFHIRIKFLNENVGWIAGGDNVYAKTTTSGDTWIICNTGTDYINDLYGISPFADTFAWIVEGRPDLPNINGYVLSSLPSDTCHPLWNILLEDATVDFLDCFFLSPEIGWVVGGQDEDPYAPVVLYTENGGTTWEDRSPPFGHTLRTIQFLSDTLGYAVGMFGTVIKTVDGGLSWEDLSIPVSRTFFDMEFQDPQKGVVVGDSGLVYFTFDGGQTWDLRTPAIFCGDANGDGIVTLSDAITILLWLIGQAEISSCWAANTNGDSSVSASDAIQLTLWTVGMAELSCGFCQ